MYYISVIRSVKYFKYNFKKLVLTTHILYSLCWQVEEVILFPKKKINSFKNSLQYAFEKE